MNNHWLEAQQQQRTEAGHNIVLSLDERNIIVGKEDRGWILLTPKGSIPVRTAQGMDLLLEELEVPHLGWH